MAALALIVSLFVAWEFAIIVALSLVLAWLYSVPPVRLKSRPGADVAVNAIGIGILAPLAGWAVVRSRTLVRSCSQRRERWYPHRMLPVVLVAAPVLVVAYHGLIGRARTQAAMVRGIVVCSCLFLASNSVFALMFSGTWR